MCHSWSHQRSHILVALMHPEKPWKWSQPSWDYCWKQPCMVHLPAPEHHCWILRWCHRPRSSADWWCWGRWTKSLWPRLQSLKNPRWTNQAAGSGRKVPFQRNPSEAWRIHAPSTCENDKFPPQKADSWWVWPILQKLSHPLNSDRSQSPHAAALSASLPKQEH